MTTSQEAFLAARAAHVDGDLGLAEAGYRQAIDLDPSNADAIHLLGVLCAQNHQLNDAENLIRQALRLKDIWAFHDNLGKVLQDLGKTAEARDAYLRAAELNPDHAEGLSNAAVLSLQLGDLTQAALIFRRILDRWPDQPVILNNLGNILFQRCRYAESEQSFRRAITLDPAYAMAHYNLGNLLTTLARHDEAIVAYRSAIRCQPDYPEALNNLGNLYLDLRQYVEAETAYLQALRQNPHLVEVISNLGNLYSEQKRHADAEKYYRQALSLNPGSTHLQVLFSYCLRNLCAWREIQPLNKSITAALAHNSADVVETLQLFSEPGVTPIQQLQAGLRKVSKDLGSILQHDPLVPPNVRGDGARLRIGYLSADFHEHATMHLLQGVLQRRDTAHFETWLYSFGPNIEDPWRQRARESCEHFVDIRTLGDKAAAEIIAKDNIDILVDLKGYTTDSRLGISAWRPAPIIVSWLGYPGTLGHPRLADYLIGDPVVTPPEHASHYSETLALMPHSYQPTDSLRKIGRKPTRREAGLPEEGFVFCSFNQPFKINPDTFSIWCRLLRAHTGSVLWLLEHTPTARANLCKEAEQQGVDPSRIIFAKWASQADHLGRLQLADIALDTFPYGSHTTGSDALWAGVPLISRLGDTFSSRVSASLLTAVQLPELIARNWDEYHAIADRLAARPEELANLKARLAAQRLSSPLFDTEKFTRDLERMYRTIWQQRRDGSRQLIVLQP